MKLYNINLFIVLFFIIICFSYSLIENGQGILKDDSTEDSWTDFILVSCDFNSNTYFFRQDFKQPPIDPENVLLELNVSKFTPGYVLLVSSSNYADESADITEHISRIGNYSFSFNTSLVRISIAYPESHFSEQIQSQLSYIFFEGVFRIKIGIDSEFDDWAPFTIGDCWPSSLRIFDTDKDTYNVTTHLNITEIRNGTLSLRQGHQAYPLEYHMDSIGIYQFNSKTSYMQLEFSGEISNGSLIRGKYYLENFGFLGKWPTGFESIELIITIVITVIGIAIILMSTGIIFRFYTLKKKRNKLQISNFKNQLKIIIIIMIIIIIVIVRDFLLNLF